MLDSFEVESCRLQVQCNESRGSETLVKHRQSVRSLFLATCALPLARAREPLQKLQVRREVQGRVLLHLDIGFFLDIGCTWQDLLRRRQARGLVHQDRRLREGFRGLNGAREAGELDLVLRTCAASQLELPYLAHGFGTEVTGVVVGILGLWHVRGSSEAAEAGLVHVSRLDSLRYLADPLSQTRLSVQTRCAAAQAAVWQGPNKHLA